MKFNKNLVHIFNFKNITAIIVKKEDGNLFQYTGRFHSFKPTGILKLPSFFLQF